MIPLADPFKLFFYLFQKVTKLIIKFLYLLYIDFTKWILKALAKIYDRNCAWVFINAHAIVYCFPVI